MMDMTPCKPWLDKEREKQEKDKWNTWVHSWNENTKYSIYKSNWNVKMDKFLGCGHL